MAKKKKRESMAPSIIDDKIIKEQAEAHEKWLAGRDACMFRVELLGGIKSVRRSIRIYKKMGLDRLFSLGMGYSQKEYQWELKKELKLIEDIEKESAALLKDLEEFI